MFLVYLLIGAIYRRCGRLKSLHQKLARYFIYNGIIRLFTETFIDLYVTSLLNIVAANWKTSSALISASNVASVVVFALCNLTVLLLASVYFRKFGEMNAQSNYGALLEGTKLDAKRKSKWNLLLPAFLFGRRICFTLSLLLIRHFLWAQIAVMFLFSTAMVIFLLTMKPFESPTATKLEVFNEVTLTMLSYGLMMFTDFVPDP